MKQVVALKVFDCPVGKSSELVRQFLDTIKTQVKKLSIS